jgi:hypothetical protein
MNSYVKGISITAAVFWLHFLASGKAGAGGPDGDITREEQSARAAVNALCGQAITSIYGDIAKLAGRFPVLAGLSKTNILSSRAKLMGGLNWEHHSLRYFKNLRVERPPVDPKGPVSATGEVRTLDKGGLILEIYLRQRDVKVPRTRAYLLPYGTGDNQLRLILRLEENPPDAELDKAVRDIVDLRVGLVKRSLESM